MRERLLHFLRCSACRRTLKVVVYERDAAGGDISAGLLSCECGSAFPVWRGVPRMLLPFRRTLPRGFLSQFQDRLLEDSPQLLYEDKAQRSVKAYSFDTQWSMYEYGEVTWELDLATRVRYFYEYLQVAPRSLNRALVLDAGCGNGTLTAGIAASGPEVIGMDYSETVERAEREKARFAGAAAERVHYVQADIQSPPFSPETFDIIYSDGVLHHTANTETSFKTLVPLVKHGGRYFVWLYRNDASPMFNAKLKTAKALQRILRPLPLPALKYLCFSGAAILVLRLRLLALFGNHKRRIVPLRLKAVNLFDTLTPRFYHLHTPAEVHSWFASAGFPGAIESSIPTLSHGGFGMLGVREYHAQTAQKQTVANASH